MHCISWKNVIIMMYVKLCKFKKNKRKISGQFVFLTKIYINKMAICFLNFLKNIFTPLFSMFTF